MLNQAIATGQGGVLPERSIIRVPGHCMPKLDLESWDFRLLISSQDTMQAFPTGLAALACGHRELERSTERTRDDVIRRKLFLLFVTSEAAHISQS